MYFNKKWMDSLFYLFSTIKFFLLLKKKKIKRIVILIAILAISTTSINFISQSQILGRVEHTKTEFSGEIENSKNSSSSSRMHILKFV